MSIDGQSGVATPDVSFVMPCYNEQDGVAFTARRLTNAFRSAGHRFELVTVENGSTDRTGEVLAALAETDPSIVVHVVEENQGYGHGVLSGIPVCSAPWVGIIPADGQVDAEDVVRLYEAAVVTNGRIVAKVRRRFRMDGVRRKVVSAVFNVLMRMLWPGIGSLDVNGSPKLLRREVLQEMKLESKDWLLDCEIMIAAHRMQLRVLELSVFARMRGSGVSHVRPSTVFEFIRRLVGFRFSPRRQRRFRAEPPVHPRSETPAPQPAFRTGSHARRVDRTTEPRAGSGTVQDV